MKTLVIIPSRLAATRLPGKPLLKINGKSIISHVVRKAQDADIGDVYVATEDKEILDEVKKNNAQAVLTSNKNRSGTDRIYEAIQKLGKSDVDLVMNLQGDEPLIDILDIKNLHSQMIKTKSKLGTLASKINEKKIYNQPNIVKVTTKENLDSSNFPEALNFTRMSSDKIENTHHHLGIYCFQFETLKKFVSFKQSENEIQNRLEQFRALDNNIPINVALAKTSPIGVDTIEDFVAIKKIMEYKN